MNGPIAVSDQLVVQRNSVQAPVLFRFVMMQYFFSLCFAIKVNEQSFCLFYLTLDTVTAMYALQVMDRYWKEVIKDV